MKKLVMVLAAAAFVVSCKKVAAGGNQGVLRMEEDGERYDTHETRAAQPEAERTEVAVVTDSTAALAVPAAVIDSAQ